jgi:ATP-dependent DNA helicase RecQ
VGADLSPAAASLFERLRAWRGAAAKEQGVPAYVIFHDSTLREIALRKPRHLDDLATVTGVGAGKLERYGSAVMETLSNSG